MNRIAHNAQNYPDYETIRVTINYSLEGLLQTVTQYILLLNTQAQLELTQEKASILDDMVLLKAYLDNMTAEKSVLPATVITAIPAEIKAEYAYYIEWYGYPVNGIFDVDKLAYCIRSLAH